MHITEVLTVQSFGYFGNVRVSLHELKGCGFKSRFYHFNFRYRACFEQEVPWQSGSYRV